MAYACKCLSLIVALSVSGCATMPTPGNAPASQYQSTQQIANGQSNICTQPPSLDLIADKTRVEPADFADVSDLLGPGDRLRLLVSGDKSILSGDYVIGSNGRLVINGMTNLAAAGRPRLDVQRELRQLLLERRLVRDIAGNVLLSQIEAAGVQVSVEGAVFEPGLVRAGERPTEARANTLANPALGDYNIGRSLATALRAAGGIRPDAAAQTVYLMRGSRFTTIDVTPAFTGGVPADPQLVAGDRIYVPSLGCFQQQFVRPSSVTSPGIRVYLSNLSRPASSNSAAGINKDSTSFPYGVRMLDGLVAANCVGGSAMNGQRQAVLISRNPLNGQSVVIARSIEGLVRKGDRDLANPYLMPGDAIACYDSDAMMLADAVGVVGNLLGPALLIDGFNP